MKKLLALFLACVLCLGLCVPALAEEDIMPISDVIWDEDGTAPMPDDYPEEDRYAAYEAAHPEELAGLDADALIAGWGYEDITAQEQFMDERGWYADTVEEAVKEEYITNRLAVEDNRQVAELYRAEYPEAWEDFDAYAYFADQVRNEYEPTYQDAAAYMAAWNILTEDEFVDDMFVRRIDYFGEDDWDEPTLTLMVNGEASEAALTAENGVSYADAAELRSILGETAVAADVTGPVAVRAAAEAAGWDVVWYDGWDEDQEVQLWDKKTIQAELEETLAPWARYMELAMGRYGDMVMSQEPQRISEDIDLTLTRFSTLDGNTDYTARLGVETVMGKGVVDCTITFDVADFFRLFTAEELAEMTAGADFSLDSLTALLKEGKAEVIVDLNTGDLAVNIPLLALADESLSGWQVLKLGSLPTEELAQLGRLSYWTGDIYENVLSDGEFWGAADAWETYQSQVRTIKTFYGPETLQVGDDGSVRYHLTTQQVNEMASQFGEEDDPFQKCDIDVTMDKNGKFSTELDMRLDMSGQYGYLDYYPGVSDLAFTIKAGGAAGRSTTTAELHWNNQGKLTLAGQTNAGRAGQGPRAIDQLPDATIHDLAGGAPDLGVIGGADGPTEIVLSAGL